MTMLGCSCPKTLPNGQTSEMFFINLEKEDSKRDNAICFFHGDDHIYIFKIVWKETEDGGKWWIDMTKNIEPPAGRLYQTFPGYRAFSVVINGVHYTSKFIENLKGEQRVVNGDLLCSCLIGKANANDVMIAATEVEDKKNEIEELQNMVSLLSKERTGHLLLIEELEKTRQEYFELRDMTKKFLEEFAKLLDTLGWFKMIPAVRKAQVASLPLTKKAQ